MNWTLKRGPQFTRLNYKCAVNLIVGKIIVFILAS